MSRPLYELSCFRLYKREPIAFPHYLALSANHFNPKWTGERRLKVTGTPTHRGQELEDHDTYYSPATVPACGVRPDLVGLSLCGGHHA